jgi:hypothetical protein
MDQSTDELLRQLLGEIEALKSSVSGVESELASMKVDLREVHDAVVQTL